MFWFIQQIYRFYFMANNKLSIMEFWVFKRIGKYSLLIHYAVMSIYNKIVNIFKKFKTINVEEIQIFRFFSHLIDMITEIVDEQMDEHGVTKKAWSTKAVTAHGRYSQLFVWKSWDSEPIKRQLVRVYLQVRYSFLKFRGFIKVYVLFLNAGYMKHLFQKPEFKKIHGRASLIIYRSTGLDRLLWPLFFYLSELFETYVVLLQLIGFGFTLVIPFMLSWFPLYSNVTDFLLAGIMKLYGISYGQRISLYIVIKTYALGLLIYQVYLFSDVLVYFKNVRQMVAFQEPMRFFDLMYVNTDLNGLPVQDNTAKITKPLLNLAGPFLDLMTLRMTGVFIFLLWAVYYNPIFLIFFSLYFTSFYENINGKSVYFLSERKAEKAFQDLKLSGFIDWLSDRYPKEATAFRQGKSVTEYIPLGTKIYQSFLTILGAIIEVISWMVALCLSVRAFIINIIWYIIDHVIDFVGVCYRIFFEVFFSFCSKKYLQHALSGLDREILEIISLREREDSAKTMMQKLQYFYAVYMDPIYGEHSVPRTAEVDVLINENVSLLLLEQRLLQKLITLKINLPSIIQFEPNDSVVPVILSIGHDIETAGAVQELNDVLEQPEIDRFLKRINTDISGTYLTELKKESFVEIEKQKIQSWGGLDCDGQHIMRRLRVQEQGLGQVSEEEHTRFLNWHHTINISASNAQWLAKGMLNETDSSALPQENESDFFARYREFYLKQFADFNKAQEFLSIIEPVFLEHPFIQYLMARPPQSADVPLWDQQGEETAMDIMDEIISYLQTIPALSHMTYELFQAYFDAPLEQTNRNYKRFFRILFGTVFSMIGTLILFFANEHWFYLTSLSPDNLDALLNSYAYHSFFDLINGILYECGSSGLLDEYAYSYDSCYSFYTLQEGLVLPDVNLHPGIVENFNELPPYPELRHPVLYNALLDNPVQMIAPLYPIQIMGGALSTGATGSGIDEVPIYETLQFLTPEDLDLFDLIFDRKTKDIFNLPAEYQKARSEIRYIKNYKEWFYRRKVFADFWSNPFAVQRWPEVASVMWTDLKKPVWHEESALRKYDREVIKWYKAAIEEIRMAQQKAFSKRGVPASKDSQAMDLFEVNIKGLMMQARIRRLLLRLLPGLRQWLFEADFKLEILNEDYHRNLWRQIRLGKKELLKLLPLIAESKMVSPVIKPLYLWPLVDTDRYQEYLDYTDLLPDEFRDASFTYLFPVNKTSPLFWQDQIDKEGRISTVQRYSEILTSPEYKHFDDMWDLYYYQYMRMDDLDQTDGDDPEELSCQYTDWYLIDMIMQDDWSTGLIEDIESSLIEIENPIQAIMPYGEPLPSSLTDHIPEPHWNRAPYETWIAWPEADEQMPNPSRNPEEDIPYFGDIALEYLNNLFLISLDEGGGRVFNTDSDRVQAIKADFDARGLEYNDHDIFAQLLEVRPQVMINWLEEYQTWQELRKIWAKIYKITAREYFEDVLELMRGADDFFEEDDYEINATHQNIEIAETEEYIFGRIFRYIILIIEAFLYKYQMFILLYIDPYFSAEVWGDTVQQMFSDFML